MLHVADAGAGAQQMRRAAVTKGVRRGLEFNLESVVADAEVVRGCAKAVNVPLIELLGTEENGTPEKETRNRSRRQDAPTLRGRVSASPQPTREDYCTARTLHRSSHWTVKIHRLYGLIKLTSDRRTISQCAQGCSAGSVLRLQSTPTFLECRRL